MSVHLECPYSSDLNLRCVHCVMWYDGDNACVGGCGGWYGGGNDVYMMEIIKYPFLYDGDNQHTQLVSITTWR